MESQKPSAWRGRTQSIAASVMGMATASFPVGIFLHFHTNSPILLTLIVYGLSAVVLTRAWQWFFERRNVADKIPTSSKERRRQRKEFYDWLDSQGRR